ncbi:MAG: hypothetical protein DME26_18370 [Verrucomicrobia bacterium]|nr:MAG: hypothetical protein DME26_18370 [Verrucomicrobiota bacterium]
MEWQALEFEERTGILCELALPGQPLNLKENQSTALFRILQECLTNVGRHARTTKVQVLLNTDGRDLCLEVTDNGRGIEQGAIAQPRSLGLVGMRERALALGGKVRFEGVKGKGTKVTVRVPLIATDVDEAGAICRRDRQKRQQAQSAPMCLNFPGRLDGQRIEPAAESQA